MKQEIFKPREATRQVLACTTISQMVEIAPRVPRTRRLEKLFLGRMINFAKNKREEQVVLSYARPTSHFAIRLAKSCCP